MVFDELPENIVVNRSLRTDDMTLTIIARMKVGDDKQLQAFYNKTTTVQDLIEDVSMTLNIDADTVDFMYKGKRMESFRTLDVYLCNFPDKRLLMIVKLKGGGKRAMSRPGRKQGQAETLAEFKSHLADLKTLLKTSEKSPLVDMILENIKTTEDMAKQHGAAVVPMVLKQLPKDTLKLLSLSTSGSEFVGKIMALSKAIFQKEVEKMESYRRDIELSEKVIYYLTCLAATTSYHNDGVGISWTKLETDILNAVGAPETKTEEGNTEGGNTCTVA